MKVKIAKRRKKSKEGNETIRKEEKGRGKVKKGKNTGKEE